jgi:peptidoglycan lytic transglycosylase
MVRKRKSRSTSLKTPRKTWILAGASSLALAAVVVTVSTVVVHADARLSRPATTMSSSAPVTGPTPTDLKPIQPTPQESAIQDGDRLHGIASWYGARFNGRKTASGERYDMYAMTACHNTLPFGSVVRVVNKINHRSVVVRINDRGNLMDENRIIDLSYGAAERLGMTEAGLAKVDLHVLSLGRKEGNQ